MHIKERRHHERKASPDEWVKDLLLRYVQLFPQVSCHLEINVDRAIYGQGRFRSFTFQEMWQWYSLHKSLQDDPQAGTDHERKMAKEAHCSVQQWLVMKVEDITTKSLKRFRQYILDKEVGFFYGAFNKKQATTFHANVTHPYITETSTGQGPSRSSCQLIRVQR